MSQEEKIHVDEETTEEEKNSWTEEFVVAGNEIWGTVKKFAHEATVRRIVITNEAKGIHFQVPMLVGVAGIALLPVYSAIALIAALVVDCTILVERVAEKTPDVEVAAE
ncbi:MAG: DUF4342 domain-containing protein [Anaerolineales bacterium]|nr:DUF4342 domain-containing protein [Anaerolineales bacterium]MCA9931875.1 DUF4342 domain-containing protein [Anaerolineales bacterium]